MRAFSQFIGVDLGGGKGKNTAVARLRVAEDGTLEVVDYGTGKEAPWYDDRLVAYLREQPDALVAIDAPLTLPSCLVDGNAPIVTWFRERENGARVAGKKPKYTPYTQRATEVILHEEHQILPRETLGQGMGPLAARGVYLVRELAGTHRLDENLIEVYPKATLIQLFGKKRVDKYKRSAESPRTRLEILNALTDVRFAPGQWRQHALDNDHKFDAIMCAYTAYLWSQGRCVAPTSDVVKRDGWIWLPEAAER
jgi:predicted RNase H-like nuclease